MGWAHPIRDWRRRRLARAPFPADWAAWVDRRAPIARGLGGAERTRLEYLMRVFLAETDFEGCGGQEVGEEMRVVIAAQACLLLLGLPLDGYDRVGTVLVYPGVIAFDQETPGFAGTVIVGDRPVSGLATSTGTVILSWPDAAEGARRPQDGCNVVLHEFAHQLDQLSGTMNGAPPLARAAAYPSWHRVLGEEHARLRAAVEAGVPTFLGDYAATSPAEFFAVVTENFFERPVELRALHPALYAEFRRFYGQDPAARLEGRAS